MQVLYFDIEPKLALGNARAAQGLDDLLARADIVSLHVPETPQTKWMIGAAQLAKMRAGSMLINAARGTRRRHRCAGGEPEVRSSVPAPRSTCFRSSRKGNDDTFVSPLIGMDNVILTPHVGGSTLEAQDNIGREVAAKLVRYSDNGSTLSAVNFPEVSLPGHPNSQRLLHIHKNVPGILSRINEIFSRESINIDAQFLQTDAQGRLRRHRRIDLGRTRRRTQGCTRRDSGNAARKSVVLSSQEVAHEVTA